MFRALPRSCARARRLKISSALRYFSAPASSSFPSPQHSICISKSTNPYFNLTFEDWLFRHKRPEEPLLLIYRDDPCVVIGRNQNPWKEVNFEALDQRPGIPWIRRRSGGGTVYHDLGNTNFSIHLARPTFDRHVTAQIVLRAVRSLGIDALVNDRNDICVGKEKVSGSAYKIVNKRAYHHGTMLISTQLDTLGDLLRTNKDTMVTKGVASVRSPVCNLQQFSPDIGHDAFTSAVVDEFRKEYRVDESPCMIDETDDLAAIPYIHNGLAELSSWDWAYGQTPEFTYTISQSFAWGNAVAGIRSKHGVILSCSLQLSNSHIPISNVAELCQALEGKRYGFFRADPFTHEEGPERDLEEWLRAAIHT